MKISADRFFVRAILSLAFVLLSLVCLAPLLFFKVWEGFVFAYEGTRDSIIQIWTARGIPELDKRKRPRR